MSSKFTVSLKRRFLAGLTIIIPLLVIIFVIKWLIEEINKLFNPFSLIIKHYFHIYIPDIGLIPLIIIIFIFGFLVTNIIGKNIIDFFEKGILKIPLVNLLYKSTKQWVDIFSSDKASFKKFVLVRYQNNKFVYGFLTSETNIGTKGNGDDIYCVVFIPTNHLYIGFSMIVKKEDMIETNITIENGIQIILSAGISFPDFIKIQNAAE
jgi:uncharacterized membrane protein